MRETKQAVPAVGAAIRILRHLSLVESARAYQIADELAISRSSCHGILKALVEGGILGFNLRTKAYVLGTALIPLGALAAERDWYIRLARPYLREWVDTTQLTIFVARLLPDREFIVVDAMNSSHIIKVTVSVGQTFPVTSPAMGGAQLAFMPEADAQRIIRSSGRRPPDRETIADNDTFLEELPKIRTRGWAVSRTQYYRNANAVAAPVLVDGQVTFVICSLGSTQDLPAEGIDRFGVAIKMVADRIADEIRHAIAHGVAV
ncbi:IclR family transcriptional regulator [bacterium]|nr:MAG: IclR family transcriptional regulator [bacterium]